VVIDCRLPIYNSYSVSEKNILYVWNSNVQHHGHKDPSVGRILSHPIRLTFGSPKCCPF